MGCTGNLRGMVQSEVGFGHRQPEPAQRDRDYRRDRDLHVEAGLLRPRIGSALLAALNAELRQALECGQLFLEYQPQVEIKTGRITGVEALVRWRHPERGVLDAAEFIPAAEQSGLLVSIDRWVLREACRQGQSWVKAGIPESLLRGSP